jgi:hypothetical protein
MVSSPKPPCNDGKPCEAEYISLIYSTGGPKAVAENGKADGGRKQEERAR